MSHFAYAAASYASALDTVEKCLRTGQTPYISNYDLAQMRMYRHQSARSRDLPLLTRSLFFFLIALAVAGMVWWEQALLWHKIAAGAVAYMLLVVWVYGFTVDGMISRIGGGRKVQKRESAKILNRLIKQEL